ncbi:uncharacterized protein [Dermacentor andersoni]|uniref:uncharacterized protein n=1 Tax=Dermacentor andersoni TaxID=34620 RepID=UPI0024172718|nr:uncharacterized protein LOC126517674 [Dermacentor andersoni]
MLAQCLAKCEVECLGEFLTADDRPLDDAELIRKNVFVAVDENIGTGATFGEDPSLPWLGEGELCESDATLEEQVSKALDAVIEESKMISSQEKPHESQSANAFADPATRQPSVVEQIQSQTLLTFAENVGEPGDSDDDKCPDLGHPAKVVTQRNGQLCQNQGNAANSSEFTHREKDTLSTPSTFGTTAEHCSVVSNAGLNASGTILSEREIDSGIEDARLVNSAKALRKLAGSEKGSENLSRPSESVAECEKLGGDCTEDTEATGIPCPATKVKENFNQSGFSDEVLNITERSIEALSEREHSSHAQRLSIMAVTCVDKKDNVAIVAPRTVNQMHLDVPFATKNPGNVAMEPKVVEFSGIFECDWDDALPESSEPDITFGTSTAVEFEPSPYIVDNFASDAKSVQPISCNQEKQERHTEGTPIRYSIASHPKQSVVPFERGVSLTPLSGGIDKATHVDKELVHCSRAYSIERGIKTSFVPSNSPQIHTRVTPFDSSAVFPVARTSLEEENEKAGTKPRAKRCCEPEQDALEEGWSTAIFEGMPDEVIATESTADRWDTTGNSAFGSPVPDCPIIDEERITLQPFADDETVDSSLISNTGHKVRLSEQTESPSKCFSAKNSGYIYAKVPEDLLEEVSPRRKVRLERLKENMSTTKLGARGKISDWYKPLSGNTKQQIGIGTNGRSSELARGKQQRNTRMLDSSGIFRNKRKRKPLCDQSNRITRYFPARKRAATVPLALCGDKTLNAGAYDLPDLTKFRYNRVDARSRTPVNGSTSAYSTLNEAEDHYGCNADLPLHKTSFGHNLSESSDMSDSADAGTAYVWAARKNSVSGSLVATSDMKYAGWQNKPSLLGVIKHPARWENDRRKVPGRLGVGQLTADTDGGVVKNLSRSNDFKDDCPEIRAGIAANCSETSPGSQMPHVRTSDVSRSRMPGAKRNMVEDVRDVSHNLEVALNAQFSREWELGPSNEKQGNDHILGFPRGFTGSRSTDNAEFCFEQRPQEHTSREIPCTKAETGYRCGVFHANGEVSDSGVPPCELSDGFYEAVTFDGVGMLAAAEQRNVQTQAFEDSQDHVLLGNQRGISTTGEREHDLFKGRDAFHDASRLLGREHQNKPCEDDAVASCSNEQFSFDRVGEYDADGRVAYAEGGIATRRDDSWDRRDGATVQATEDDERRVLQIIQDTLRGPVLQTLGRSSASQKAHVALNPKRTATPLSVPARQPAAVASSSTNIGAQNARQLQGAASVAPITVEDPTRSAENAESRKSALRWPGHLNVRNLAAKLVMPQQERKQVDRTAIEQLLKPPKSNNPLANSFMTIRGVKLQGPNDVAKSTK